MIQRKNTDKKKTANSRVIGSKKKTARQQKRKKRNQENGGGGVTIQLTRFGQARGKNWNNANHSTTYDNNRTQNTEQHACVLKIATLKGTF